MAPLPGQHIAAWRKNIAGLDQIFITSVKTDKNLVEFGLLRAGYAADIVVLDPATVIDKGTFIEPNQCPEGIAAEMVNGAFALLDSIETYARSGAILRKGA